MEAAAQDPSLFDELSKNQENIRESLPWEEIGDGEKIERLRKYIKQVFAEQQRNSNTIITTLLKRIETLEHHQHNEKGEPVIVKRVDQAHDDSVEKASYPYQTSIGQPMVPGVEGYKGFKGYI